MTLRGPGRRVVQRLDSLGHPVLQDAEGFAPVDSWMADSLGDRVWIGFNNGLYGASWVFDVPSRPMGVHAMRGNSQEFGDVSPPPPYPIRPVMLTRIACPHDEASAKC